MTINDLMRALVDELIAGDVPDPQYQEFPLALIWFDLCRLAGETPPAAILAVVDDCSALSVPPLVPPLRGSYAEHARQFPEYAD